MPLFCCRRVKQEYVPDHAFCAADLWFVCRGVLAPEEIWTQINTLIDDVCIIRYKVLLGQDPLLLLGIETSCDETAAALIENKKILSHCVHTQDHSAFGGVVPQISARQHVEKLPLLMQFLFDRSGRSVQDVKAVGVTSGPGLIGGLLAGVLFARGFACATGSSLYPIHHLEAHALMVRMEHNVAFPYLLVLLSGGHCMLVRVDGVGQYHILGQTYDDAVGECLDKVARCLGGPYPGGPFIEDMAKNGDPHAISLPTPLKKDPTCNLSFSGLKTACMSWIQSCAHAEKLSVQAKRDLCASLQRVVADSLCQKIERALHISGMRRCILSGGVASNMYFRQRFERVCHSHGVDFFVPSARLCTDNGVMIAWALKERIDAGCSCPDSFQVRARWPIDTLSLS
jgi:N6-L-threonylcarbamoyladenine synthase